MTRQTWTAVVAALCFAACTLVAVITPVPFLVRSPGQASDLLEAGANEPVRVVRGAATYATSGRLLATTAFQTPPDARVTLVEALYAYWATDREVLPRYSVYPAGITQEAVAARSAVALETSELDATAAALRMAGIEVEPVPVVAAVNATGPSAGQLAVHDTVTAIGYEGGASTPVQTAAEASAAIASGQVGGTIVFSVLREGVPTQVQVTAQGSKSKPDQPVAGVTFIQGYRYAPELAFSVNPAVGGDGGLMLGLAVYDKVSPDPLLAERDVAGAGGIDANGVVQRVTGIQERITAAERAGASIFLLPTENCADVAGFTPTVRLVPVASLSDAVASLGALAQPDLEKTVKGCP